MKFKDYLLKMLEEDTTDEKETEETEDDKKLIQKFLKQPNIKTEEQAKKFVKNIKDKKNKK